jgi:hypothetical protein
MIWRAADPCGSAVLALVERIWRPFPRITRPPLASAVRQCLLWPASSRHDTVASAATLRCRLRQLPFPVSAAPGSFARRHCCQHRSTPLQGTSVAVSGFRRAPFLRKATLLPASLYSVAGCVSCRFRFPARPAPSQGDTVASIALLRRGVRQLPLPVSGAPESCANGAESRIFFRVVHSFAPNS